MTTENTSTSNAPTTDWKERELGALWRREGKNQNFLSGMIRIGDFGVEKEIKLVVFTNKGKLKNERAPDFIIYQDSPREESVTETTRETSTSSDPDLPTSLQ